MKINLVCLLALICPALSVSGVHAADEDRVSAVIVLQDADVASLKQTGYIKMAIPPNLINRVDSVTLKRPVRFKDESAVLFNDVDRRSGMVSVRVDDSTIEQIDYQPVELKIYESGFSSIVVEYRSGNSTRPKKASKDDSAIFVANLANSKSLTGRLADMKEFTIKSGLGKVDVDLDEVSQITFEDKGRAKVLMENGDELSGKIAFSNITMKSRWGLEDLKVSDLVNISKSFSNSLAAPSSVLTQDMPLEPMISAGPVDMQQPLTVGSNPMPMSMPQTISIPQASPLQPMGMPVYSPLQSYPYPSGNVYTPNNQRIDVVPQSLDQSTGQGYDPHAGQMIFDQAVDQLMQPINPSMQPMEMMPMDQTFFGGSMPIGEQPVGGFGEMIQNPQEIPTGQPFPQTGTPDSGSDFWFFPQ